MHEAIIPALILGIAVVLVGVFATGGTDMMRNALIVDALEVTQLSVISFDSENRLVLTVKNIGTSSITNVTASVYAEGGITSNPVLFSGPIDEGDSQGISEILIELDTETPFNVVRDKEVTVLISGVTYGNSAINLDPVIVKVR